MLTAHSHSSSFHHSSVHSKGCQIPNRITHLRHSHSRLDLPLFGRLSFAFTWSSPPFMPAPRAVPWLRYGPYSFLTA